MLVVQATYHVSISRLDAKARAGINAVDNHGKARSPSAAKSGY